MARATAISISGGAVKIAALESSRKKLTLALAKTATLESGASAGDSAVAPSAGDVWAENHLSKKNVVLVVSSANLIVRKIAIPLKNESQIRRTIKFQAEKHAGGPSPSELYADFMITRREDAYTELILIAARKTDIEKQIAALSGLGLEVGAVVPDFAARFFALDKARAFENAGTAVAVSLGGEFIQMLAVKNGKLLHTRTIPAAKFAASAEFADALAKEIDLTRVSSGIEGKLSKVVLAGDVSCGPSKEELERACSCDVSVFNPKQLFETPGTDAGADLSRFDSEIGSAAASLAGTQTLDLLRGEREAKNAYELIRKPLLAACVAFLLFLGFELLSTMSSASSAGAYLDTLRKDAKRWYDEAMGPVKPRFTAATFAKEIKNRAASGTASGSGGIMFGGFLDFMNAVSGLIGDNGNTIIHAVSFKGKNATLRGEADNADDFEKLAKWLEDSKIFEVKTQFRARGPRRPGSGKSITFTIELKPKGA